MKTITYDETLWQLVPKKITSEMIDAMCQQLGFSGAAVSSAYYDALAAAPTPAQQPRQESEIAAESLTWQPIETAPKDGTEMLLLSWGGDIGVCYWLNDAVMCGWTWGMGKAFDGATHWMPLPAAPKREAGK